MLIDKIATIMLREKAWKDGMRHIVSSLLECESKHDMPLGNTWQNW